ncbi:MAG: rRNA maturation RNase YbeY [Eubacteriales bacterium]|nr:rRNA maturation RNase YbeY [Eubacteriales bacterium]
MNIIFDEGQVVENDVLELMTKAATYAIEFEKIDTERTEISVSFVEAEEIKDLNCQYRNIDKVTDVLSFPQFEDLNDLPEEGELFLGDVVICKERAEEQAKEFGHSFKREIIYLFVHSVLHLVGYDHMDEEDKTEMRKQEEIIMSHIGLERK